MPICHAKFLKQYTQKKLLSYKLCERKFKIFIEIGKKETTVGKRKTWDFSNTKHIELQASFTFTDIWPLYLLAMPSLSLILQFYSKHIIIINNKIKSLPKISTGSLNEIGLICAWDLLNQWIFAQLNLWSWLQFCFRPVPMTM